MRRLWCFLIVASFAVSGIFPAAGAEDDAAMRQELETLRSRIERIDADLVEAGQKSTELAAAIKAYSAKAEAAKGAGQKVKEEGEQLAARRAQVAAEHDAVAQLCNKKTASPREYKAAVAHCKEAGQTYQHHADEVRQEYEKLKAAYAAFTAEDAHLKQQHDEIERRRHEVQTRQAALRTEREQTLQRFTDLRERLIALQAKPR